MDKPPIKREDTNDYDNDNDNEEMEPENTCPECGEYKNSNRKACDSCIFST